MPSPLTHAAAGFAAAAWTAAAPPSRKTLVVAALAATVPDLDLIGWPLHVSNASLLGHRALSHSLSFACLVGLGAAWLCFRDTSSRARWRLALSLILATATHGLLDGLSTYSLGVEYFAPFSQRRYRLPWTPLGDLINPSAIRLSQELFLFVLMLAIGFLALRVRRRAAQDKAASTS